MPALSYLTLHGTRQGFITAGVSTRDSMGDGYPDGHRDKIPVQAFSYGASFADSRQPRTHLPLTVTKMLDKSSPLLGIALTTGERFEHCRLELYRTASEGRQEHYFTVELEDAVVTRIELEQPDCQDSANAHLMTLETVHFSYRKITWTHEVCGTVGIDELYPSRHPVSPALKARAVALLSEVPVEQSESGHGLTVFLGGAGMNGGYIESVITALKEVGISNSVYGDYSALMSIAKIEAPTPLIDTLGDAVAVIFFNQAEGDSAGLEVGEIPCPYSGADMEEKRLLGPFVIRQDGNMECPPTHEHVLERLNDAVPGAKAVDFSLEVLGVKEAIPKTGQFNLIGYSWGGVIAARSAEYHARKGVVVDNLVLIGAPINRSLKRVVSNSGNIKNVVIFDLVDKGDPIYAGMTDAEIIRSAPLLGVQMLRGDGHFYYSGHDAVGQERHRDLARKIYAKGLR